MNVLNRDDVARYVEENIGTFHQKRISSLDALKLSRVLKRKNPYLFKAKHVLTADEIVRGIVDAHISSQEETIFGDWLEGLAIYVNQMTYGGFKSGILGVDLEFDHQGKRYIVAIKSGPNWGNSSQIGKMVSDFRTAQRTLRTGNAQINVVAINGCCYGKASRSDFGDYIKLCGQAFWEFISGDVDFYLDIIEPLGHGAKEKNDAFILSYSQMLNKFTKDFANEFCKPSGEIDWEKLVRFNSSKE